MSVALEAKNLTKAFGTRKAVDNVSFQLPAGAFLSVFGPNGAGKTTLLRLMSTLAKPTSGSVAIYGVDTKEDPEAARRCLGVIGHQPMLYADLTAEENLKLFAQLYGVPNPDQRVLELLAAVELKSRRLDPVRTYSRGMTQRLSIARALINDPQVVFLDEPYSGLDPHAVEVFDSLLASVREGRTFVMVSHDLEKGLALCTHSLIMARGKVVDFQEKALLDQAAFRQKYAEIVGAGVA